MDARDAEVRAIATLALQRAKQMAELRKPQAEWAMNAWWLPATLFTSFLCFAPKDPAWLGPLILSVSFFATIACFYVATRRLQQRTEALTILLLEQQDR
ncbi:hypothetical protein GCM10027046_37070 [Uliginosibacterium flavum]|uniref:Uncharacterized protein n=1 Tax=Uliginosibacterium flavum TaxID=1396831 RepID=A0ABV2TM32_9RHOO